MLGASGMQGHTGYGLFWYDRILNGALADSFGLSEELEAVMIGCEEGDNGGKLEVGIGGLQRG